MKHEIHVAVRQAEAGDYNKISSNALEGLFNFYMDTFSNLQDMAPFSKVYYDAFSDMGGRLRRLRNHIRSRKAVIGDFAVPPAYLKEESMF